MFLSACAVATYTYACHLAFIIIHCYFWRFVSLVIHGRLDARRKSNVVPAIENKMGEKRSDVRTNGSAESKGLVGMKNNSGPIRLWHRIQGNEWTFSLLLFLMSFSIVLKKLYTYYGSNLQLQNSVAAKYVAPSTPVFSNVSNLLLSHLPDVSQFDPKQLSIISEKFVNVSQYGDVVSVTTSFYKTFGWLIRAAVCGLIMMGFTWFIIYKDSNIPGINPPSPFTPSKHRLLKESRMQMNYFIGILNGVLIFVYMCL